MKKRFLYSLFYALLCASFSSGAATDARTLKEKFKDILNGLPYAETLFSNTFQQRFSLSKDGIAPLDSGLLAIALEVSAEQGSLYLQCGLHLYVDSSSLSFELPANKGFNPTSDAAKNKNLSNQLIKNDSDAKYWLDEIDIYTSRLLIKSKAFPKKGVTDISSLQSYNLSLYPGIAYFYFTPSCSAFDRRTAGKIKIWLNKTHAEDNFPLGNNPGNAAMIYGFNFPERLSKSFMPMITKLDELNENNREHFWTFFRKKRQLLKADQPFTPPK